MEWTRLSRGRERLAAPLAVSAGKPDEVVGLLPRSVLDAEPLTSGEEVGAGRQGPRR